MHEERLENAIRVERADAERTKFAGSKSVTLGSMPPLTADFLQPLANGCLAETKLENLPLQYPEKSSEEILRVG